MYIKEIIDCTRETKILFCPPGKQDTLLFLSSTFFAFCLFFLFGMQNSFAVGRGICFPHLSTVCLSSNSNGAPALKAQSDQHPAHTLSPPTLIHFNVDSHRRTRPWLAEPFHTQIQRAACRPYKANRRALLPAVVAFNLQASHSFTTLYYSTGPKWVWKLWSLYWWDTHKEICSGCHVFPFKICGYSQCQSYMAWDTINVLSYWEIIREYIAFWMLIRTSLIQLIPLIS